MIIYMFFFYWVLTECYISRNNHVKQAPLRPTGSTNENMISANARVLWHFMWQPSANLMKERKERKKETGGNPKSKFSQKLKTGHFIWKRKKEKLFPGNVWGHDSVPWEQNKPGQVSPQVRQSSCINCCESLGLWKLSRTSRASQGAKEEQSKEKGQGSFIRLISSRRTEQLKNAPEKYFHDKLI